MSLVIFQFIAEINIAIAHTVFSMVF